MSVRETSLQALHNVVMARKNIQTVSLCFFLHKRNLTGQQPEMFSKRIESITQSYFNDFEANNQSTQKELKTVHFLLNQREWTQEKEAGEFKRKFTEPANRTMANCHGCIILSHPDKFELEKDTNELEQILGELGERTTLWGAVREENYVHREFSQYLSMYAPVRKNGADGPLVCLLPINKTQEWWNQNMMARHALMFPTFNDQGDIHQRRHLHLGAEHIKLFFRKIFHSTVGYQRDNAFDFVSYMEMAEEKREIFLSLLESLRDVEQNPEWKYVVEGSLFFGKRMNKALDLIQK